jgi:hypothetical protein
MALIEGKMTDFVERQTGLPREEARVLQKRYYTEHGTTLAGLMIHHGSSPRRSWTRCTTSRWTAWSPTQPCARPSRLPGRG